MNENEIGVEIVDAAYQVHTNLGPGLLESVYESVMEIELQERGLKVERQVIIPIIYKGHCFKEAFRVDLMVEKLVIAELKSVEKNMPLHYKQVTTQLKLSGKRLGFLINFGVPLFKQGITRLVNGLPD